MLKKIHLLILNAFIRPFIVTFFVVMFILLMFFLFKYADDIIGKGFEWYVIVELMFYASATNVSMALPLSILLSSIMTFGTLGENYELVAIKSAGISLRTAMIPLFILIVGISIASFYFSDFILPKATQKYGTLLYDVRNQKLSFLIKEGVFNTSIPGYAIKVDKKDEAADSLHGIMIYDHTSRNGISTIILAKSGRMYRTDDGNNLILKLIDGIRYEESSSRGEYNNPRQTFSRMRFDETEQLFDFSSFQMNRSDEASFANVTEMLNLEGLKKKQDSLSNDIDSLISINKFSVESYFRRNNLGRGYTELDTKPVKLQADALKNFEDEEQLTIVQNAANQASSILQVTSNQLVEYNLRNKDVIKTYVEYERKFTLAASCLVLFFIGAPMGAIIRKGGLGLPVVISVIFFLIYHVITSVAEKSVKEGSLDITFGMWLAIIVLTPIGAFLTYKASVDSALFDVDYYKQLIAGKLKKKKKG